MTRSIYNVANSGPALPVDGGRIWAQPQDGMRVRICVELPRADIGKAEAVPADRPSRQAIERLPA